MYLTELDRVPRQRRTLDDHIQSANVLIQEDRRIIASEVAQMLDIRQTAETCNSQLQKRAAVKNCSIAPRQCRLPPQRCGRNNTNNSKPHVRGSATSTLQTRPRTV